VRFFGFLLILAVATLALVLLLSTESSAIVIGGVYIPTSPRDHMWSYYTGHYGSSWYPGAFGGGRYSYGSVPWSGYGGYARPWGGGRGGYDYRPWLNWGGGYDCPLRSFSTPHWYGNADRNWDHRSRSVARRHDDPYPLDNSAPLKRNVPSENRRNDFVPSPNRPYRGMINIP